MERSLPLKENFNITHSSVRNERHSTPCRAMRGMAGLVRSQKTEAKGKSQGQSLYWGFCGKVKAGQSK